MFCSGKLGYASFYLWQYFYCSAACKEDQEVCDGKSTILSVVQSSFCNDYDPQLLLKTCPQLLFALLLLWRYSGREQHFGSTVSFRKHCLLFLFLALVACSHPSRSPTSHLPCPPTCPQPLQVTLGNDASVTTPLPTSSLIHSEHKRCASTTQSAAQSRNKQLGARQEGVANS